MRSAFLPDNDLFGKVDAAILLGELAAILLVVTLNLIQVPMPVGRLSQSYPPPTVTMVILSSHLPEGEP